jgi:hypothetical protein
MLWTWAEGEDGAVEYEAGEGHEVQPEIPRG